MLFLKPLCLRLLRDGVYFCAVALGFGENDFFEVLMLSAFARWRSFLRRSLGLGGDAFFEVYFLEVVARQCSFLHRSLGLLG